MGLFVDLSGMGVQTRCGPSCVVWCGVLLYVGEERMSSVLQHKSQMWCRPVVGNRYKNTTRRVNRNETEGVECDAEIGGGLGAVRVGVD